MNKPAKHRLSRILTKSIAYALPALAAALPQHAEAVTYTWNQTAAGTFEWSTAANWDPNTGFPNATADIANINNDIAGAITINLATGTAANRTINELNLGDASGTSSFTIAPGVTGSNLIFGGANPVLDITGAGGNTISAGIQAAANLNLRSTSSAVTTISGVISNDGTVRNLSFSNDVDGVANPHVAGQGQFLLGAANTVGGATGTVSISDVRVATATVGAFGANAANTVTVSGAGQAYITGGTHVNNFVLNSTGWTEAAGNFGALRIENATISGTVSLSQNTIIGVNSNTTSTISGVISGNGGITKAGGTGTVAQGVLVLSGANTFTGPVTVANGTLRVTNAGALGTNASVTVQAAPQLGAGGRGNTFDINGGITIGAGKTITLESLSANNRRSTFLNGANNNTWAGNIVLSGNGFNQIEAGSGTTLTINGSLTSTGAAGGGTMAVRGAGTVVLNGNVNLDRTFSHTDAGTVIVSSTGNSWTSTQVSDGQIQLGINEALDDVQFTFGQTGTTNGRLELNGFSQTVTRLNSFGASTGTNHILRNSNRNSASTLTFATPTATTDTLTNVNILGTQNGIGALHLISNSAGRTEFNNGLVNATSWTVNSGTIAFTGNSNRLLPGIVTGAASSTIEKAGTGTLAIRGTYNQAGSTNVTGGILALGSGTTGAINVADGATLATGIGGGVINASTLNFGSTAALSGFTPILGNPAAPAAISAATLTTTSNTITVAPQGASIATGVYPLIDYGTIGGNGFSAFALGPVGSYPHITASLVDNTADGRVDLEVTAVDSLIWSGATNSTWDVNTTQNFTLASNTSTPAAFYQGDSVLFGDTADVPAPATPVTNRTITGGAVSIGTLTFNNSAGVDYSVANPLTGAGGVVKTGAGTVTLSGANTYAGATSVMNGVLILSGANSLGGAVSVTGGTLRLGNADALRNATSITVSNGGTFDAGGIAVGSRYAEIVVSGAGVGGNGAIVNSSTNIVNNSHFNVVTLAGDTTWGGTGRYDIVASQTFNGGAFTLTKTGAGEMWYNPGAGSTLENVVVNGGVFGSQGTNPLSATATVTVNNGATHQFFGAISGQHNVALADGGTFRQSNATTGTLNGSLILSGTGTNHLITPIASGTSVIAGKITGPGGFTMNGAGTMQIQNATNDYLGDTRITSGTLNFNATGQLPTSTNLIMEGGTFANGGATRTVASLTGTSGTISGGGTVATTQSSTTVWNGILNATAIRMDGTGSLTLGGGSGATGDNPSGNLVLNSGTVIFAKGNGTSVQQVVHAVGTGLTVNGGTLQLGGTYDNTTGLGTGVNLAPVGFDTTTYVDQIYNNVTVNLNGGVFDLNGRQEAINGLVNPAGVGGVISNSSATAARLYVGHQNASSTFGGTIVDGTGFVSVHKIGTGTLTLSGSSAFAGGLTLTTGGIVIPSGASLGGTPIAVNGGVFTFDGTQESAPISVNAGTFTGTGTSTGTLTAASGSTIQVGTASGGTTTSSLKLGGLILTGGANINLDFNTAGTTVDKIETTTIAATSLNGTNNVNVVLSGAGWVTGSYPILTYTGPLGGTGAGALSLATPVGHSTVSFVDNSAGTISLNVTAVTAKWVGGVGGDLWDTNTTLNWNTSDQLFATGDTVLFDDTAASKTVNIAANQIPSGVTFDNTDAYTVNSTGTTGIAGTAGLIKKNTGTLTITSANTYTGTTDIQAGTVIANYNTGTAKTVFAAASAVNVEAGATLQLVANDANITFANALSGSGTVIVDPHLTAGAAVREVVISGNNAGFTGLLKLSPTTGVATGSGTFRTNAALTPANTGGATIEVDNGGQAWLATGIFPNNFILTGMGFAETAGGTPVAASGLTQYSGSVKGGIGAIRMNGGAEITGNITLEGNAKIMAYGGTGVLSGTIGTTTSTDTLVIGGGGNGTTMILTGTNDQGANPLNNIFVNSGGTSGVNLLSIGNNGTTGTLGIGSVTLNGDSAGAQLRFDRADGYVLAASNTITSIGTNTGNTQLHIDTQGTGFVQNGVAINLGSGGLRFGTQANRTNATGHFNGNVTTGSIGLGTAATGAVMNILPGANIANTGTFFLGEQNGFSGTVNQAGGAATGNQIRVGHYPNATSVYNLALGTLSVTANPGLATDPSGTGEQNGGIYIGVDGTGVVAQSGGTLTTDWVVLDNRGDTVLPAGGVDQYNLSGGALEIRGQYGIANRNVSTEFNFTGGTIRNVGTGVNARIIGAGVFTIGSGGASTPTFDTNGATNAFTVSRSFTGSGTLAKAGLGTLNLNAASPAWSGNLEVSGGTVATNAINGGLGSFITAGRTITASGASIIHLTVNNVFGNGVGNANMPTVILDGSTLSSTRYNALGDVVLSNGATLTQAATDGPGTYEGYQLLGTVTVDGSGSSSITTTNGRANHLGANTEFNVADTTGSASSDLIVSAPLKDQSGDFGSSAGGLTKTGAGTMEIAAGSISTYTGTTTINDGTLLISGSISGSTVDVLGGTLGGSGGTTGPVNVAAGTLAPGASIGTLNVGSTSFGASATFALEFNSTTNASDLLAITGNFSLADGDSTTLTIADVAPGVHNGSPIPFISYTGIWDGDLFTYGGNVIPDDGIINVGGNTFYLDYNYGGNSVALVPEPGAFLSILGGLAVLAGSRRFRRRS